MVGTNIGFFIVSHRKTERVKTSLIIRFAFYEIIFNSVRAWTVKIEYFIES